MLAVPLGSLEQHGPHLPLDTDTRIAGAVAGRRAWRRAGVGVAVAPALSYGASGEHADFPGTLLVGHEVLADLLVELVRSARGSFAGVVFVNAHGGQRGGARRLARERCAAEGDDVLVWRAVTPAGGDAHAGRTETSLLLAIDPGAVRLDLAEPGRTEPIADIAAPSTCRGGATGIVQRRAGRSHGCECRRGPGAARTTSCATWSRAVSAHWSRS